jgi:hypothetical protein
MITDSARAHVIFDHKTQTGTLCVIVTFERGLPKEAYDARKAFILNSGGSEAEAIEYAGYLDHQKPAAAVAEMRAIAPGLDVDWQKLVNAAIAKEAP